MVEKPGLHIDMQSYTQYKYMHITEKITSSPASSQFSTTFSYDVPSR